MDNELSRVVIDPDICNGKPIFRGKRITVQTVLEFLAAGDSPADVLKAYPSLEPDDIKAALTFASRMMNSTFTLKELA